MKRVSCDAEFDDEKRLFERPLYEMANLRSPIRVVLVFVVLTVAAVSAPEFVLAKTHKRAPAKAASKKSKHKKSKKAKAVAKSAVKTPREFLESRVAGVLRDLKGRAPRTRGSVDDPLKIELPVVTTKQDWLQGIYGRQLVDTSRATGLLADKLIFYEMAKREIGDRVDQYLAKTVGLRDFLVSNDLVDDSGEWRKPSEAVGAAAGDDAGLGDAIEAKLFATFGAGFVVRPAVGVAPHETGRGLFQDTDLFIQELLQPKTYLYRPEHRLLGVRSTILDEVASGEALVLQEDVMAAANARAPLKSRAWREVRVHTYEGRILSDAIPNFWVREGAPTDDERRVAEEFVAKFLALLPAPLIARQAWSFDVLVMDNGNRRIVDVVTNRGRKSAWSTYLDQPRVLAAYTKHFEQYAGVRFAGVGGFLVRNGAGNYFSYWGLRIHRSRPGVETVLAWIPPWP